MCAAPPSASVARNQEPFRPILKRFGATHVKSMLELHEIEYIWANFESKIFFWANSFFFQPKL